MHALMLQNRREWKGIEDMDFWIGDEAIERSGEYNVANPIRAGQIENWDHMERYWQRCIYKYLRCEPEEHLFLLTEQPLVRWRQSSRASPEQNMQALHHEGF